jgi:hypothetical protein
MTIQLQALQVGKTLIRSSYRLEGTASFTAYCPQEMVIQAGAAMILSGQLRV